MNDIILNADYFIEGNNGVYTVCSDNSNYILDEDNNVLIEQDNINNKIVISDSKKQYIINKCLEDIPF